MSGADRLKHATFALAGFIPVVGWAGRAAKGGKAIHSTAKGMKAVDNSLSAYQYSKSFDKLRKTEYGIYGLASANGFGEYITGKDMFGNELSEEQRERSLDEALAFLGGNATSVGLRKASPYLNVAGNNYNPRIKSKVEGFNPKTATNKQKGNFGEIVSSDNILNNQSLKDGGYDLKPVGRSAPSTLDDKIVKGIDGLYENTNPNSNIRYVVDEAKFGSSQLGKTKDGKQMSNDWLMGSWTGNNRILDAVDGDFRLSNKITDALRNNQVERVLSKVDSSGNVKTFKLNLEGSEISEWP